MSDVEGDAKAVVREYLERVINRRDLGACDELLTADYVDHDAAAWSRSRPGATWPASSPATPTYR
jgi:hypothetical protein